MVRNDQIKDTDRKQILEINYELFNSNRLIYGNTYISYIIYTIDYCEFFEFGFNGNHN